MKRIVKYKYLLLSVMLPLAFGACSDIEGTFDKYRGEGEYSYAGKVTAVKFNVGFNRVELTGNLNYATSAKQIIVEWNDQRKTVNVDDVRQGNTCKFLIDGLKEGNTVFRVYTLDSSGKRSISEQFQVNVSGERFKSDQRARTVDRFKLNVDNGLEIEFGQTNTKIFESVYFEYPNSTDVLQKSTLKASESKLVIADFKKGGNLGVKWSIKPTAGAIDSVVVTNTLTMPTYTCESVDRTPFRDLRMATDAAQLNASYSVPRMWDNNNATQAHTHSNNGVPNHMTIDLGAEYELMACRLVMRDNPWDWAPYEFQIWGLPELEQGKVIADYETKNALNAVMLDNFANKAEWESAAIAKGWINLTQRNVAVKSVIRTPTDVVCTFDLYGTQKVRYIRYRTLKTLNKVDAVPTEGATAQYTCTAEMYLWKKM